MKSLMTWFCAIFFAMGILLTNTAIAGTPCQQQCCAHQQPGIFGKFRARIAARCNRKVTPCVPAACVTAYQANVSLCQMHYPVGSPEYLRCVAIAGSLYQKCACNGERQCYAGPPFCIHPNTPEANTCLDFYNDCIHSGRTNCEQCYFDCLSLIIPSQAN